MSKGFSGAVEEVLAIDEDDSVFFLGFFRHRLENNPTKGHRAQSVGSNYVRSVCPAFAAVKRIFPFL